MCVRTQTSIHHVGELGKDRGVALGDPARHVLVAGNEVSDTTRWLARRPISALACTGGYQHVGGQTEQSGHTSDRPSLVAIGRGHERGRPEPFGHAAQAVQVAPEGVELGD